MQRIIFGIDNLKNVIGTLKVKKVLLVADSSFGFLNIRDSIESQLEKYVFFDHFDSNPQYDSVCEGVRVFNDNYCDAIVAVGGGSSMDVAKCIKLYCRMDSGRNYLEQDCFDTGIPIVAIPTTAGTGSESTRFAVIYYQGAKQSVNHLSIIPDYAILEPKVLKTLPDYQKRCTLMDALCQGIESWWSVNSTPQSQAISKKAVEMLYDNLRAYLQGDEESSARVMEGANLAGQAINITQTTAPHAFSYKLTSMYKLPHGHAVALCMREIWPYMLNHLNKCVDKRGTAHLENVLDEIANTLHCKSREESVEMFSSLVDSLMLQRPQSHSREEDLEILSQSVNPVRLKNHPIELNELDARNIYERIVQ